MSNRSRFRATFHPHLARYSVCGLWLATGLASCSLDERALVYQIGAHASASNNDEAGAPSGDGAAAGDGGNSAAAGSPSAGAGDVSDAGSGATGNNEQGGAPANGGAGSLSAAGAGNGSGGSASGTAGTSTGGTAGAGSNGGGGSSGTGVGGTATAGSGGAPFVSPCGDLNHNLVDDCEETLVQNSRFDTAVANWDPEPSSTQQWSASNASGAVGSGAISVVNVNLLANLGGTTTLGSRQCLKAWAGQRFDVAAKVFIKGGQGTGKAGVNVIMFAEDACAGTFIEGKMLDSVVDVDAWHVIQGQVELPAGARSMAVRLVAVKPLAQASFDVLFDDVLVSEKK